jgi:hypothetical protein
LSFPLLTCSVKLLDSKSEGQFSFLILTSDDTYKFYGESQEEVADWVNEIRIACEASMLASLGQNQTTTEKLKQAQEIAPEKRELISLMELPGNSVCADCGVKGIE